MSIEQRVNRKPDRPGRLLIITFCIAPVVVPLLAIGFKFGVQDRVPLLLGVPAAFFASAKAAVSPDLSVASATGSLLCRWSTNPPSAVSV